MRAAGYCIPNSARRCVWLSSDPKTSKPHETSIKRGDKVLRSSSRISA